MADAGLDHLAPWLEGYLQRLEPAARRPFLRKLAKALRDANARRIRDNVEPDGTPMPPQKPARPPWPPAPPQGPHVPQGRPRPQPARPDQPRSHHHPLPPLIEPTARIHHFGEEAPVDPHIRNSIRTRYPARSSSA
jgi:hypothetical protein